MEEKQWSVWAISDADEPEDHVLVGMRHRDYDGVMLVLRPDGKPGEPSAFATERTIDGRPTRPLLFFYKGSQPSVEDALHWILQLEREGRGSTWFPFPEEFSDPPEPESTQSILVGSAYPPYPWLDAARLGMHMGRCYSDVEHVDLIEPTEKSLGRFKFRFYCRKKNATLPRPSKVNSDDLLPF